MKHQIFLLATAFFIGFAGAQQETYLSHFSNNLIVSNPAVSGLNGEYQAGSFHHRQWLGLYDYTGIFQTADHMSSSPSFPALVRPVTTGFWFSAPIEKCKDGDKKIYGGYSLALINDNIGYEKNNYIKASISSAIRIRYHAVIRLGIEMNYLTKNINTSMLRAHQNPDPMLPAGLNPGDSKWISGAGIYYQAEGKRAFWLSAGLTGITQPLFTYYNYLGNPVYLSSASHILIASGIDFSVSKRHEINVLPRAAFRSVRQNSGWVLPQLDLRCLLQFRKKAEMGGGLRFQKNGSDALVFQLGFYPSLKNDLPNRKLRIGYAYDMTLQNLRYSSHNTHEIQINYIFIRGCGPKIDHPRDLKQNRPDWTFAPRRTIYSLTDIK